MSERGSNLKELSMAKAGTIRARKSIALHWIITKVITNTNMSVAVKIND